ncbi:MAG: Coenzyme F420 hydrogenase/dehydrogenase, beta subunit C-terminal domain [Candidatus Hydrothermarchaeales archaeon]
MDSLAYVGTPCQIQAIRKANVFQGDSNKDWPGNAKLLIGLFCRENWSYTCIRALVEDDYGVKLEDIKKFDIKRNRLIGYKKDGSSVEIPLPKSKPYVRINCQVCLDFSSEMADISVGAVGTPMGWSAVVVRTKAGADLLDGAEKAGVVEVKPIEEMKPGIGLIKKLCREKREENVEEAKKREDQGIKVLHVTTKDEKDEKKLKGMANGKQFAELEFDVIDTGLCVTCGMCEAVCPVNIIEIKDERPELVGEEKEGCNECYLTCPRTFLPLGLIEDKIGFNGAAQDDLIGNYSRIVGVRATDENIKSRGQDGGAVTALLSYALDSKMVDAAVSAVGSDEEAWKPLPYIARESSDLVKASGTIYSMVPTIKALKQGIKRE